MSLSPDTIKLASRVISDLDLLWRRHLDRLEEPFELNLQELRHWRERIENFQTLWNRAWAGVTELLIEPNELIPVLSDDFDPFSIYFDQHLRELERAEKEDAEFERWREDPSAYKAAEESDSDSESGEGDEPAEESAAEENSAEKSLDGAETDETEQEDAPTREEVMERYRSDHASFVELIKTAAETLPEWMESAPERFANS